MNGKRLFPVLCIVMLVSCACGTGNVPFLGMATPTPTQTSTPTPTNTPTQTPAPPTATATQPDSETVSVLKENGFVPGDVNDCGSACTTYQNSSAEIRAVVYENGTVAYSFSSVNPKIQGTLIEKLMLRLYGKNVNGLALDLLIQSSASKSPQSATIDGYKLTAKGTTARGAALATVYLEVTPDR